MLDINYIRENKERVKKSIEARKAQVDLDKILELDDKRRDLIKKVDEKRAVRNAFPKEKPDQSQLEHMQKLKQEIDELEPQLKEIEEEYEKLMYLATKL